MEYIGHIEFDEAELNKKVLKIKNSFKKQIKMNKSLYTYIFGILFSNKIIKEVHSDTNLDTSALKSYEKLKSTYNSVALNNGADISKFGENPNSYIIVKERDELFSIQRDNFLKRLTENSYYPDGNLFSKSQELKDYTNYNSHIDNLLFGEC